jgi:hypothetical protein
MIDGLGHVDLRMRASQGPGTLHSLLQVLGISLKQLCYAEQGVPITIIIKVSTRARFLDSLARTSGEAE